MVANLFELRLTEVLREEEGATYSPGVSTSSSRLYKGYGFIGADGGSYSRSRCTISIW